MTLTDPEDRCSTTKSLAAASASVRQPLPVAHAAVYLVMATGRALLPLNHQFFKSPKYLESLVAGLGRKTDGYTTLADQVLSNPSPDSAGALAVAVDEFHAWSLSSEEALSRFVEDNEFPWLTGALPPEYS